MTVGIRSIICIIIASTPPGDKTGLFSALAITPAGEACHSPSLRCRIRKVKPDDGFTVQLYE